MENKFRKKIQASLNNFEKWSKEWEWSDLITWLQEIKSLLEKYQESTLIPEQNYALAKRLSQCLNPNLPSGLHSKTLEIYKLILQSAPIESFHMFSAGLFPYFEYCSAQNKMEFLLLIEERYVFRITELKNVLSGLVSCLLSGAEGRQDIFSKVSDILDKCAERLKEETYDAVFRFILRTSRHRASPLIYLQKKSISFSNTKLAVNAMLAALSDPNTIIKRHVLDLIKIHFPITSKELRTKQKVALMEGSIKLLSNKDSTLIRRLWEWAFPGEFDESQINLVLKILKPAIISILESTHKKIELHHSDESEIKINLLRIIDVLVESEGIGDRILEQISISLMKHTMIDKLYFINEKFNDRVIIMFREDRSNLFWKSFHKYLPKALKKNEITIWMSVLDFALAHFENDKELLLPVLDDILLSLPCVSIEEQTLDVCLKLCNLVQSAPTEGGETAIGVFLSLSHEKMINYKIFSQLGNIIGLLSNLGLDCSNAAYRAKELIFEENPDLLVISVNMLLFIQPNSISHDSLERLWHLLETSHQKTALDLLLRSHQVIPNKWQESLCYMLTSNSLISKIKSIHLFSLFWTLTENEELKKTVDEGQSIYIMLDHLIDENPIIRHSSKEWLITSRSHIPCLLDPLYFVIFHPFTVREELNENNYLYQKPFDARRVMDAFKKVRNILRIGEENLKYAMDSCYLSPLAEEYISLHKIHSGTYLEVLQYGLLMYLNTECNEMKHENSIIQSLACDILEIIFQSLSSDLAFIALESAFICMHRAIENKNTTMQFQLLKIIPPLIYNCKIESDQVKCEAFFLDSYVVESVTKGMLTEELFLRAHWMDFITNFILFMTMYLPDVVISNYIKLLLDAYISIIANSYDLNMLDGLTFLIHHVLRTHDENDNKENSKMEWHQHVLRQLESVIALGVTLNEVKINHSILNSKLDILFSPLTKNYSNDFLFSFTTLWSKYSLDNLNSKIHMQILLGMIPTFKLNLDTIFEYFYTQLEKDLVNIQKKAQKTDGKELCIAHFLYHLTSNITKLNIPVIPQQLFWSKLITLFKCLMISTWEEMPLLILDTVYGLRNCVYSFNLFSDKKIKKELQELVGNLFDQISISTQKWERDVFPIGYPGFENEKELKLYQLNQITLSLKGYEVSSFAWPDDNERICSKLVLASINARATLSKTKIGAKECGILILAFINKGGEAVAKELKKDIVDFLGSDEFIFSCKNSDGSLKYWKSIFYEISRLCYQDKTQFLNDALYKFQPSFWTSLQDTIEMTKKSLIISSLIVISGKVDDYLPAVKLLKAKLLDHIKIADLFPHCMLFIRVMSIRLNLPTFKEIWSVLFPDIHIRLLYNMSNTTNISYTLSALKFLDTMIALDFEDLNHVLWIYMIDIPEVEFDYNPVENYMPIITKTFLNGFNAKLRKRKRAEINVGKRVRRKMQLSQEVPGSFEDLDRCAKALLQFCMFYRSELGDADVESIEDGIIKDILFT